MRAAHQLQPRKNNPLEFSKINSGGIGGNIMHQVPKSPRDYSYKTLVPTLDY